MTDRKRIPEMFSNESPLSTTVNVADSMLDVPQLPGSWPVPDVPGPGDPAAHPAADLRYAQLMLDAAPLVFETSVQPAFDYLRTLPTFFNGVTYSFSEMPGRPPSTMPTCRYDDGEPLSLSYDAGGDRMRLQAPWSIVPHPTDILRMSIWLLREHIRQRAGRIRLHASAVCRDNRATLLIGQSESGKTTTMLELCLRHGYQLCANDSVDLALVDGSPTIVGGDKSINFRFSSINEYSAELAASIFMEPHRDGLPTWKVKRQLHASDCGIPWHDGPVPITQTIFLRLDKHADPCARPISPIDDRGLTMWAKATLFHESCALLRGVAFTPVDPSTSFVPLLVPSLDTPALLANRIALLNALFDRSRVSHYRGGLAPLVATIVNGDRQG